MAKINGPLRGSCLESPEYKPPATQTSTANDAAPERLSSLCTKVG
jgi:hypothetical protein